jgi:hypothetical protein
MIRRHSQVWPDPRPFKGRDGPIRLLAVSDEVDPALRFASNREAVGAVDAVLGCGDLEPSELAFLADAFCAPLAFVRGNHDVGIGWNVGSQHIPAPIRTGRTAHVAGLPIVGFPWPSPREGQVRRDEGRAWRNVLAFVARRAVTSTRDGAAEPPLIISHAPPLALGDVPGDAYHRGFAAYAWLVGRLHPPLWLHGHTPVAANPQREAVRDGTIALNVTGVTLVELRPPDRPHMATGR